LDQNASPRIGRGNGTLRGKKGRGEWKDIVKTKGTNEQERINDKGNGKKNGTEKVKRKESTRNLNQISTRYGEDRSPLTV